MSKAVASTNFDPVGIGGQFFSKDPHRFGSIAEKRDGYPVGFAKLRNPTHTLPHASALIPEHLANLGVCLIFIIALERRPARPGFVRTVC